jgi:hypothetical protein
MFFLIWNILLCLWGIIIGNSLFLHLFLIIFYLFSLFYLNTENFKKYFNRFFYYGKYVLYSRYVKLKSGLSLPIFFFSPHTPKSGSPSSLPEGYIIKENPRSHMPYLKKISHKNSIKKLKNDEIKENKKNNVLYVIYKPKKDRKNMSKWVILNNDKILSNHRKKQTAIKRARIYALKNNCRVLVKNINGRFSYGFKPKN